VTDQSVPKQGNPDQSSPPRVTDKQLLQIRSWGATHRQIASMLGLRRNTVSVRLSRIDRAHRASSAPEPSPRPPRGVPRPPGN